MDHQYKTHGVCSTRIRFTITDGKLHNVTFDSGCEGNLRAIGKLVEGKDAKDVAALLSGNTCGYSKTSCADQLARAIQKAMG